MNDYSWIGGIFEGAFSAASGITTTVINGQTQQVSLEQNGSLAVTTKEQNQKTVRAVIIAAGVVLAVVVFGLFVWSNKRK